MSRHVPCDVNAVYDMCVWYAYWYVRYTVAVGHDLRSGAYTTAVV